MLNHVSTSTPSSTLAPLIVKFAVVSLNRSQSKQQSPVPLLMLSSLRMARKS